MATIAGVYALLAITITICGYLAWWSDRGQFAAVFTLAGPVWPLALVALVLWVAWCYVRSIPALIRAARGKDTR